MIALNIGESEAYDSFYGLLQQRSGQIQAVGATVLIENCGSAERPYYSLQFYCDERRQGMLCNLLARLSSDHLMQYCIWKQLAAMVHKKCGDLDGKECGEVIYQAAGYLRQWSAQGFDLLNLQYSPKLPQALRQQLENSSCLDIEGFFRFRMPECLQAMQQAVDSALLDYVARCEYHDFVGLLQEVLAGSTVRLPLVHVILGLGGQFVLLDEAYQEVEPLTDNIDFAPIGEGQDCGDGLVSLLLALAPYKICLHLPQGVSAAVVQPLQDIWQQNCIQCFGCAICHRTVDKA